jgi:hypothetical protein
MRRPIRADRKRKKNDGRYPDEERAPESSRLGDAVGGRATSDASSACQIHTEKDERGRR